MKKIFALAFVCTAACVAGCTYDSLSDSNCTEGATLCNELNTLLRCTDNQFKEHENCAMSGKICAKFRNADQCIYDFQKDPCDNEGQFECKGNNVYKCVDNYWEMNLDCDSHKKVCDVKEGQFSCTDACIENHYKCDGLNIMHCQSNKWVASELQCKEKVETQGDKTYTFKEKCVENEDPLRTPICVCEQGKGYCEGNILNFCNPTSGKYETTDCSAHAQICVSNGDDGTADCVPPQSECSDDNKPTCKNNSVMKCNQGRYEDTPCNAGEHCQDGACISDTNNDCDGTPDCAQGIFHCTNGDDIPISCSTTDNDSNQYCRSNVNKASEVCGPRYECLNSNTLFDNVLNKNITCDNCDGDSNAANIDPFLKENHIPICMLYSINSSEIIKTYCNSNDSSLFKIDPDSKAVYYFIQFCENGCKNEYKCKD